METDLHQILQRVDDVESALEFVRALAADRRASVAAESDSPSSPYGADAGGWENTTIETFLEAAVAWATASRFGQTQGLSDGNPWRLFATFLYCSKTYE